MEDKLDKRTKEYRDSQIKVGEEFEQAKDEVVLDSIDREKLQEASEDHLSVPEAGFTRCCDPHKIGCNNLLKSPSLTVQQPCERCVWKNAEKRVD